MMPEMKDAKRRADDEYRCRKNGEDALFEEDSKVERTGQVRPKVVVVSHDEFTTYQTHRKIVLVITLAFKQIYR